ncbi:hypothetical protein ERJ75_001454400 [Trypanosoma vivax]|nr:hypothetical protein ERJ75_001454400 [Trypanosoma vivax]
MNWVLGRKYALCDLGMHGALGPQLQVVFQRSPARHLVDRLQPPLTQGILPIGSLGNAYHYVRCLCLNPLQPLAIRQRGIKPPLRNSAALLGLYQCKVKGAQLLPFRATYWRRHCSELHEPRVGRCLHAQRMLAQPLARLHGETEQLRHAHLLQHSLSNLQAQ